jgi:hypothetical protein
MGNQVANKQTSIFTLCARMPCVCAVRVPDEQTPSRTKGKAMTLNHDQVVCDQQYTLFSMLDRKFIPIHTKSLTPGIRYFRALLRSRHAV